jgi:AcrR family transcriptional regulator
VAERKRLTAQDWTAAALEALATGGVAAVAVEPIAARLGATKGSFYWHYANREALLEAALSEWERTYTEGVITIVEQEPDLHRRLRLLLTIALGSNSTRRSDSIELALQPTAGHPLVAPVLERVTRRRLGYLTDMFARLGFGPEEARQRSLLAYTAYLGHAQLAHATPALAPESADLRSYVDAAIATLTSRRPGRS